MKRMNFLTMLLALLFFTQIGTAQTLVLSEADGCPGETVTLRAAMSDMPSQLNQIEFKVKLSDEWGTANVSNIATTNLNNFVESTTYDASSNTLTYKASYLGNATTCGQTLGTGFNLFRFDLTIPQGVSGCITTGTFDLIVKRGLANFGGGCSYPEVTMAVDEGAVCVGNQCFNSALIISDIDGCPGDIVPVTVSMEGMPSNMHSIDFRFEFSEEVDLTNIQEIIPGNLFDGAVTFDAMNNNTLIYSAGIASNTICGLDLGVNFTVLTFDLLIPLSATGCITTNTFDVFVSTSSTATPCFTDDLPITIDEGAYCIEASCLTPTLIIGDAHGCPGDIVPVTVSMEGMPSDMHSIDFRIEFSEEVDLTNIQEIIPGNLFDGAVTFDAMNNNTLIYSAGIASNTICGFDLGQNFTVLTFDILIPLGTTGCITTDSYDVFVSTSSTNNPCITVDVPMIVDEGEICADICQPTLIVSEAHGCPGETVLLNVSLAAIPNNIATIDFDIDFTDEWDNVNIGQLVGLNTPTFSSGAFFNGTTISYSGNYSGNAPCSSNIGQNPVLLTIEVTIPQGETECISTITSDVSVNIGVPGTGTNCNFSEIAIDVQEGEVCPDICQPTFIISDVVGCPGETVLVTVSLGGMPNDFSALEFHFDFSNEWGNVDVDNVQYLLADFLQGHSYGTSPNRFIYSGAFQLATCVYNNPESFDVLTMEVTIPQDAEGCITTETISLDVESAVQTGNFCTYTTIPTEIYEGEVCVDEIMCDPCCAPPSLVDEFKLFAEPTSTCTSMGVRLCTAPRNDCPNTEILFRYKSADFPGADWSDLPAGSTCSGLLLLPLNPGASYIFQAAYVNDLCTTGWTTIEYTIPEVNCDCPGEDMVTIGGVITTASGASQDCPDTEQASIVGAEVVITQNGEVICESTTDENGEYSCEVCPDSGDYEVCVTTTCDEPCDLRGSDLFRLRTIILGITQPTAEDYIIGDLNGDGQFTDDELNCLLRYALGFEINPDDACFIENWCPFVPVAEYAAADSQPYDNCITVNANDAGTFATDFVRGILGDLAGGCEDCRHDDLGPVRVVLKDDKEVISVKPVKPTRPDFLSLEIALNANAFKVTAVKGPYDNIQYVQEENVLKIIGTTLKQGETEVSSKDDLFTIVGVRMAENLGVGESTGLALTQSKENNILFDGKEAFYCVTDTRDNGGKRSSDFEMTMHSQINLLIINASQDFGESTLMIHDILGRQIYNTQAVVLKGENQFELDLPQTSLGVYIATIVDKDGQLIASQKILNKL